MRKGIIICGLAVIASCLAVIPGAKANEKNGVDSSIVRIQARGNGRLLVPVGVNGRRGSLFLFDTGATTTVLSERLAAKASVTRTSVKPVVTFAERLTLAVGKLDRLCIGKHTVLGIDVVIADLGRLFNLDAEIDGILGQDVLSGFNYLLDLRHRTVELDEAGELSALLSGRRIACQRRGGKIYVPAARGEIHLILDSGNPYLVIYRDAASRVQPSVQAKESRVIQSPIGSRKIRSFQIDLLEIGDSRLRDRQAYIATRGEGRTEDGFLPVELFDSIYVSSLENFVILDPIRSELRRNPKSRAPKLNMGGPSKKGNVDE